MIDCVLSGQRMPVDSRQCVMTVIREVAEFKRMRQMMIQTEKMISVGGSRRASPTRSTTRWGSS